MHYDGVELLAPAGQRDVLERVVEAGADAVYLGGKTLNMRMLKSDFNFSRQELIEAVDYLHQRNKKIYVTVNNLYYDSELDDVKDYLTFLQEIEVDALIVQDMAVAQLSNELGLDIPLHASVQMGIDNAAAARFLEQNGFARAILSKNVSLPEIEAIHQQSDLVIEFFAHGDLCISHTGQCYMSSILRGEGGNRGRCVKPCRWKYQFKGTGSRFNRPAHLITHNDLCLYPHLSDLLEAGVRSFKIEGRMRKAEYLVALINKYRRALDRIIEDPADYQVDSNELAELNKHRIRDLGPGSLFSKTTIDSIGLTGEREPLFPTGPTRLSFLKPQDYQGVEQGDSGAGNKPRLSVKVGNGDSLNKIIDSGVDSIILGYEYFRRDRSGWTADRIEEALGKYGSGKEKFFLETPRIITQNDLGIVEQMANLAQAGLDGYLVNDYGSLELLRKSGLPVYGSFGLNISNCRAARFLNENGLSRLTASLEPGWQELKSLPASGVEMELIVQGPLCGMVTDYCLPRAANDDGGDECKVFCLDSDCHLVDELGQYYRIRTDNQCRNYIYHPYGLCLFPYLPRIASAGYKHVRIDGQFYPADLLKQVVEIYRQALDDLTERSWEQKPGYLKLLELFPAGLTASPVFLE